MQCRIFMGLIVWSGGLAAHTAARYAFIGVEEEEGGFDCGGLYIDLGVCRWGWNGLTNRRIAALEDDSGRACCTRRRVSELV